MAPNICETINYFREFRYCTTCHENIRLENLLAMSSYPSLYNYFKAIPVNKPASRSSLPSPDGHLSLTVPSTSIDAANQEVVKVLATEKSAGGSKQRGTYTKDTPKPKATIGNYSVWNGTSAALKHFKAEFPDLKWSTVNDWKAAIIIIREVMEYIRAVRDGGVNEHSSSHCSSIRHG